ncbi:MAG: glycosyltransferase family 2 protein, partial [Bacteroidaceae bacterium]|nr:glycosyltransferase family 2 protein [Bacteroidaceae bacterium]
MEESQNTVNNQSTQRHSTPLPYREGQGGESAIVILNWNGSSMLRRFLPSVIANTPSSLARIIVADNGSTDDSLAVLTTDFPQVEVIRLDRNYGFAEGYNQALRRVGESYDNYLLLNSDVETPEGWLQPMLDYMEAHPDVAACQPKLRAEHTRTHFEYAGAAGGYLDALGYPYCRGRIFDTVEEDRGQYDTVADVFWATGAALLIRAKMFWEVGGLDGRFFAHQEEIDLCWRLRARGHRIVCVPQAVVYHVGGGTLPKENPRKTFLNFRNNLLLLYKNLPERSLRRVFFIRFWLDALASLVFLMKGEGRSFKAVWQARRAFRQMKKDFVADRRANLAATTLDPIPEQSLPSLLLSYHLKG